MPGPGSGPHGGGFSKPANVRKTFFRLFAYLKLYRGRLFLIVPSLLLSSAAAVAGTYMLKPIINRIGELVQTGSTDMRGLIGYIAVLSAVYALGAGSTYLSNRLILTVATGILERVRNQMFERLEKLPLSYFDAHTHGEVMSRFSNDTDTLREMLSQGMPQLIASTITVAGVLVMMFVLSPVLTLIVLAVFSAMLLIVQLLGKRSSMYFRKRQAALAACNGYIEEMIEGQREVKVFCHEDAVNARFAGLSEELRDASTGATTFAMVLMPIMGNLSYALYAAAAAAGAALAIAGRADIGTLAAFLQYTRSFAQPLTQVSQQFSSFLNALAGTERIFALIDMAPEVDDGTITLVHMAENPDGTLAESPVKTGRWAWKRKNEQGAVEHVPLRGDVRFHNVTFSYDGEHDVLHDLSLYAKPGQKIAFVGSTGAGKTTIANLITRFYDVRQGKVTYDGIDIKDIQKDDLRRSLGMVLQDTHLFTGTVRENIRYGNLDASDEDVERAARLANAHSFIRHLPEGYDTVLTADGANLSQGQRQLLAIARAAAADPPVLILDEATSSVDTRTERLIEQGMDKLMAGRTVFVIAHRLSTVRNSNAIMVLENGRIIERGDHDELLAEKGKYYELYMGMFELS